MVVTTIGISENLCNCRIIIGVYSEGSSTIIKEAMLRETVTRNVIMRIE